MNARFYDGLRVVLTPFYSLLWPSKVRGRENVPKTGAFILCANHSSFRDPLFLSVRLPQRRYTYLGKAELFQNPVARLILGEKGLGGIPIHRGQSDLNAVRRSLQTLQDGHALGIFPQGTRSKDNSPTPMLNGVSLIALRAGVPVIPAYIDGPYRPFRRVDVTVGKPVKLDDLGRRYDAATLDEATRRIERGVWDLREETKGA